MIGSLAAKVFGTRNDRQVKKLRKRVAEINALEEATQALDQYWHDITFRYCTDNSTH